MQSIFIGSDRVGESAWHLRHDEALPTGDVRWRLVAQTDDEEEAVWMMDVVARRCRSKGAAPTSAANRET